MTGILALDPATITGWAFCRPGARPVWGSVRMGAPDAGLGAAVSAMHAFLRDKIRSLDPDVIGYERPYIPVPRQPRIIPAGYLGPLGKGPPPMNADTVFKLAAFVGAIEMESHEAAIRCVPKTSAQIAKHFTGSARWGSRAEKKGATMRMCEHFGFAVGRDDNAADALALLMCVESLTAPRAASKRAAGPLFVVNRALSAT